MKTYMIRTCSKDMKSFNDFTWPESGDVACPDWDPALECGHGLHGLLLGCGDGNLLNWSSEAKWLVVEVEKEDIVDLDGKVKVNKGTVVYCGERFEAIAKLEALAPETTAMPIVGAVHTAGDVGTATAGFGGTAIAGIEGTATAGDHGTATAGIQGTATAGDHGSAAAGDYGTATAGVCGIATAGWRGAAIAGPFGTAIARYEGTAIAGDGGSATAGSRGTATVGDHGTATAGYNGRATAGNWGKISIDWYDTKTNRRRTVIGYVGEDGIEPNKPYRVDPDTGTLVLAE